MTRPRFYFEPYTGAGATFLRLIGGIGLQPLISYMGGKRRQSSHILATTGFHSGQGADHVILGDAGTWGWVWPVLLTEEGARAVAAVLRSWAAEDPRELWKRLADTPPLPGLPERVAQWMWLQGRAGGGVPVFWRERELTQGEMDGKIKKPGQKGLRPTQCKSDGSTTRPLQKGLRLSQHSRTGLTRAGQNKATPKLLGSDGRGVLREAGQKSAGGGSGGLIDIAGLADRVEQLAQAVAQWLTLQAGSALGKPITEVRDNGLWKTHGYAHLSDSGRAKGFKARINVEAIAGRVEALAQSFHRSVSVFHGDGIHMARQALREGWDLKGALVYLDPPYLGCTGYGWDSPRADVLEMARIYSSLGATVVISEAVGLAEQLGDGWHEQEITALGRLRGKSEWLTLNRPPLVHVATQVSLGLPETAA